jgi:hypothetical protein
MLPYFNAKSQEEVNSVIRKTMELNPSWAFIQSDTDISFPSDFAVIADHDIKTVTIHCLERIL